MSVKMPPSLLLGLLALVLLGRGVHGDAAWVEENAAYLKKNQGKAGVTTLPSGLQYEVLQAAEGGGVNEGPHPAISSPCSVHYRGRLIDGKEFDSSYKRGRPASFKPSQVIAGWTEALML